MRTVSFLVKPASSLCDLRCGYCFYADEARNRAQPSMGLMSEDTARTLIEQAYACVDPGGAVSFTFQGGEPTMAGLDFFQFFAGTARALCPGDVTVSFSIQTNATLLDEAWAAFFRRERFLVGVSVDGYGELHDLYRVDPAGRGTWKTVTRAVAMLRKHQVDVNALCVVTGQCAKRPERAYGALKKLGFEYIQFIACLDPIGARRGSQRFSLTPDAYGRFLCRLFDLWYRDWEQGRYHSVRLFDDYIHVLLGDGATTCATCGKCGAYYVVEGDGSVYPCDFFALDRWRMGRLGERSLAELSQSPQAVGFLRWGRDEPAACAACPWKNVCGGGCKNDWVQGPDGPYNYFCPSFRALFEHAMPRMLRVAQAEARARRR